MAYVNKYRAGFSSKNVAGYVYIDLDGYSGGVTDLILEAKSVSVKYDFGGWEDPIVGLNASFSILNTPTNFFDLLPLLTATEREYRIRIVQTTPSAFTMFSGFINCENNEVVYLKNRPIRINASSYLSKMQYNKPTLIETLETRTFIDIINGCLALTGSTDPIYVNSKLYPTGGTLSAGQTLFNKAGIYNEMFWKDNLDRDSALDIITKILTSFRCFIYWYSNAWYIERYEDIWNNTQSYVIYNSGSNYDFNATGSTAQTTDASIDFVSLVKVEQSQTIQITPGIRDLEVRLEPIYLANLTINDLTNATLTTATPPNPGLRSWMIFNDAYITWSSKGLPYKNISNAIKRTNSALGYVYLGMLTKFKITKYATTSITVKFKYATVKGAFGTWSGVWADYIFRFNWYLRISGTNDYIRYMSGSWQLFNGVESTGYMFTEVSGTKFDDGNDSADVEFTVPIGQIGAIANGNVELILDIGTDVIYRSGYATRQSDYSWFGDVRISTSGELENNNILATVNTKFLNKKTVDLDVFDAINLNIKNGIYTGSALDTRTTTWSSDGSLFESLAVRLVRNIFQLNRISRQVIVSSIRSSAKYKPFYRFTDSNQAGLKFLLTSYSYYPDRDAYDITLDEYDNTETINFI